VDATGKFLIPGLWDMHIHPLDEKDYLVLFIANGVTGVRVMWGGPVHHKWRKEISAGELIGPRMVISSPTVDGPPARGRRIVVSSEDEGRQVVRKVKREGADLVKVDIFIPRDAYFAIADEAKKQGIPFAGHVPYSVSAAETSDAGQHSIEHCPFVLLACSSEGEEELRKKTKETLETDPWSLPHVRARAKLVADITYSEKKAAELFARFVKNSTWVCPTLIVNNSPSPLFRDEQDLANDPRLKYIPLSTRYRMKNDDVIAAWRTGEGRADFRKLCEKKLEIVGAMRDAGVGLLAGTDTYMPGLDLQDELAMFVQAGLSPLEALQTATYNAAKCLGKLDSMGTVERGKVADLVLLDANPLQDIRNTQKIAAVVVGGKIFDKAALQKMLAQVETPRLGQAVVDGKIEQVKLLISEGDDVNEKTTTGDTPLHYAVRYGHEDVAELLIAKGAHVNERGAEGDTPLHYAAREGHKEIVELLLAQGADVTATTGYLETTPLHYAALGNHQKVAEILMANGAPVDSGRATPLRIAARAGHKDMIEFLISKGADVNAVDGEYRVTALHIAGKRGYVNVAALLIDKGADVNAKDKRGNTPLYNAASEGHQGIAELLIARGASVDATGGNDWTPLHRAVRAGHKDVVEMLVKKGADVNAKGIRDRTPLWYAKDRGHNEIVELLRKHGAKE